MNWRSVQSWMVVGLLFCLVLVQGMQAVRDFQADTRCKTVVENYQSVIDAQKITYQDFERMPIFVRKYLLDKWIEENKKD